ncbi:MAG: hypothetical protein K6C08_13835 [Oscillospiraceae bacterium]|nr:hypothetical protein [Oscillospiraceae bacterium]
MTLEYYLLDPTGNITILVASPVPVSSQPSVAAALTALEPETEQVGFLSDGNGCDIALRMAGGEFCGNASMSAAVIAAGRGARSVLLRVSGAVDPVRAEVEPLPDGSWYGTVSMPRPSAIKTFPLPRASDVPLVCFDGISHLILEEPLSRIQAEALAPECCRILDADALGLMLLDRANARLSPLVYVPAADTLCWENSCASGTSAVGAYLAVRAGRDLSMTLQQPGGSLSVEASPEGRLRLTGSVRLIRHTYAVLPDL